MIYPLNLVIFHSYVSLQCLPEGKKQILPFTTYTNWPWRMDGWFRQSHGTPSHPSRHPRSILRSFIYKGKPKVNKGYSRSILKDLEGKHDQTWNSMTFFPTFLWLKNRWCFHGFPMIFTIFADVRVRSGACLAAKETKQRHHAGVFRQKVDILWYVFFSRYVFDISWYVKLDRTNIWKNTENVDIAKLEEFWSTWLVETGACDVSLFLWGPDGTRNLLCWSIDLFLFCFCFVFLTC